MSASLVARQNRPQGTTLIQAAEAGDFGAVEVLIAEVDVNSATEHGMTALMTAAANGHLPLVSLLLEHGADINGKRCDGLDALALGVFFGHLHVVRELLDRGAYPGTSWFGTSPEMWAKARGFHDIAQVLTDARTLNFLRAPEHQSDESNAPLTELASAQEPVLSAPFFSDEGISEEAFSDATAASPIPVQTLPESTYDYEWSMGSIDLSELTIESPASVWNVTDEARQQKQVQPRNRETIAEPLAEVTHSAAVKPSPVITRPPRALPDEKQPFPIYSTYVPKPRYHHKRNSGKLVRCLAYITSDWQRLTIVTLIVMLLSGLGTLAVLTLLNQSKPSRAADPAASVAEPLADLPQLNTQNDLGSTTRVAEIPSTSGIDAVSGEQSVDSAKRSEGSGAEVNRIEHPSSLRVADQPLRKSEERTPGARPKQGRTPKREAQAVSRPVPSLSSAGVSAKRIPPLNVAHVSDIALEDRGVKAPVHTPPAPLSIEIHRPRSVAARKESPTPVVTPGRNTKTKVIQWP